MEKNKSTLIKRTLCTPCAQVRLRESGTEDSGRTLTGYAILFGVPSEPLWFDEDSEAREIIAPEAITKELLDSSDIKFTMYHDRSILLGRSNKGTGTLSYFIDEKGVGFELELPKSPNGDEALELVSRGDIAGCSFAFSTYYWDRDFVELSVETVDGRELRTYTVRRITGIYDFTLASDPAYSATSVETRELRKVLAPTSDAAHNDKTMREQWKAMRSEATKKIL